MLLVCRQSRLSLWEYHNRGQYGLYSCDILDPSLVSYMLLLIETNVHFLSRYYYMPLKVEMLILSTEQGYVMCVHGSFYVWTLSTISMILSSRWRDGATRRVQLCLASVMIFGKTTGVQFYLSERNFKFYLWSVWKIILDFSGTGSQSTWNAWGKSWRPYLKHQEARKWT
jgi:hypothetical protein